MFQDFLCLRLTLNCRFCVDVNKVDIVLDIWFRRDRCVCLRPHVKWVICAGYMHLFPFLITISSVLEGTWVPRKFVVFKTIPLFPASSMTHAPFIMHLPPRGALPPCCSDLLSFQAAPPSLASSWHVAKRREGGRIPEMGTSKFWITPRTPRGKVMPSPG